MILSQKFETAMHGFIELTGNEAGFVRNRDVLCCSDDPQMLLDATFRYLDDPFPRDIELY